MKKSFPGFYSPTNEELSDAWTSDTSLFVFDTNTLLNLYSYEKQTRADFFSIVEALGVRAWLPYHVVLEYQRRRLDVVKQEKAVFREIEDILLKIEKILGNDFQKLGLKKRFPKLHESTDKLESNIKKSLTGYRRSLNYWDEKQPCVRGHDEVREKLDNLFEGKVGELPTQQELDEIYKAGAERYKRNTPPGYEDKSKANDVEKANFEYGGLYYERQFGDLIIWKQIIKKAKDENIKSVIFITDDSKDDWWYILNSRGEKTIGPRAELREEILNESGIELFNMYNTSGFLKAGEDLLQIHVNDESIDDADRSFNKNIKVSFSNGIANLIPEINKTLVKTIMANNSAAEQIRESLTMRSGIAALEASLTKNLDARQKILKDIAYQEALVEALRGTGENSASSSSDVDEDDSPATGDD